MRRNSRSTQDLVSVEYIDGPQERQVKGLGGKSNVEYSRFDGGAREQVYLVEAADNHIYLSPIKPGERQLARDRRRQVE